MSADEKQNKKNKQNKRRKWITNIVEKKNTFIKSQTTIEEIIRRKQESIQDKNEK